MEKTTTLIKKCFRLANGAIYALFAFSILAFSANQSFAQITYCNAGANYNCSNYNMYIGGIEILQGSNTIFYKADDGCNMASVPNYTLMSTTPSFSLVSGGTYTFKTNTGTNYDTYVMAWIDLNGDGNFASNEYISTGWGYCPYTGATQTYTFTLPCNSLSNGVTRMRVRSEYYYNGLPANMGCGNVYYGEVEDYTIEVKSPSSISANFFMPDTAYVGTIVNLVNGTSGAFVNNWDIGNTGSVNYTTENAQHIFNSTGTYEVKLFVENCAGADSIVKQIVIVNPTAPPVADFVSTKNNIGLNEEFQLVDLSTNGPTYWSWALIKGFDTIYVQGGNPYLHKNPNILTGDNPPGFPKIFPDIGKWDVCLIASNVVGSSSSKCKAGYIEVVQTVFEMDAGLRDVVVGAETGTLTDDGGLTNNYTTSGTYIFSTLAPCGAQSVTLVFKQWKVLSNANLKIYDGVNALGTPLHPGNGFNSSNAPTSVTANSGAMYLIWETTSGTSDSGFIATWTSVSGTGNPPVADFELPGGSSTLYNAVFYSFTNTSLNAEGTATFEWRIDGVVAGLQKHLENRVFYTNKTYTIKLSVIGCDGTVSSKTKTFTVVHPGTPTNLDFTVSNQRPSPGEIVTFTAISDKANRWEWTFFPGTDVTPEGTVSDALNVREFSFSKPGKYTVQCKGYNSIDSTNSANTVIKANYVVLISPCTPIISVTTSTDVANSRFRLEDVNTGKVIIDNPSSVGVAYEDFGPDLGVISLNYGATYEFTMTRSSNTNPMSRKVWIDWNVDGDFEDAGELVGSQSTGTTETWTSTFTVPDVDNAVDATTKLRLGVSYGTDPNHPCGAAGAPNANRIGEFEDYSVRVVNDGDAPVITLIGNDTVYVEQNATGTPPYMDAGATAWDPSQGDITSSLESNSTVDLVYTGIYEVVYTVRDASGNEAVPVIRYVFVVVDQTPPVITLNGVQHDTIEVGSNWADAGASAIDNKSGNLDNAIVVTGSVDPFTLGTYEISYTVKDAQGNETIMIRTVTVVDTQVPVITNASAFPEPGGSGVWIVETQLSSVFVDVTAVSDNYNSVGNGLDFTADPGNGAEAIVDTRFKGSTLITYTAMDESGNTTVQQIRYVVQDYEPPVIDLHTLDTVYHDVNTPYSPVSATAADNLYGQTEISLSMTSNVNPFVLGMYADTYIATDASGNVSTRLRYVKVVDRKAPVISGKNGPIIRVGLYSEFAAIDRLTFTDNYYTPASLKTNTVVTFTDINTYKEGMYSAVFVTTDGSGNVSEPYTLYVVVSREELRLGVDDLNIDDVLNVSPNPSSGMFTITVDLPENEDIAVEVYNGVGQKVQDVVSGSVARGSYQIDLSDHGQGIYYVRMTVRGTVITKKVMVQY